MQKSNAKNILNKVKAGYSALLAKVDSAMAGQTQLAVA